MAITAAILNKIECTGAILKANITEGKPHIPVKKTKK